jgi:hypothetical protein
MRSKKTKKQIVITAIAMILLASGEAANASTFNLATSINWKSCSKPMIVGLCGAPVPYGYIVSEWLPTNFDGTVKTPGYFMMPGVGSLIAGMFGKVLGHTEQVSQNGTDNTFVVHIWGLTNQILALSSATLSCFGCSLSAAQGLRYNAGIGGQEKPSGGKCGDSSVIEGKAIGAMAKLAMAIPYMPIPEYFSELDSLNWRTGCRDFSIVKMLKSNSFTCSAESDTKGIGDLSAKIRSIVGKDACIGDWGPLYPRQMRDIGPTNVIASATEAYRGMSEAATVFDTMSAPLSLSGKMQEAYPKVSKCFHPGASIKKVTSETKGSKNGNYGWIYWVHTSCCVPFTKYEQCVARMAT